MPDRAAISPRSTEGRDGGPSRQTPSTLALTPTSPVAVVCAAAAPAEADSSNASARQADLIANPSCRQGPAGGASKLVFGARVTTMLPT